MGALASALNGALNGAFNGAFGGLSVRRIGISLLEAMTAPRGPDRYLEWLNPLWSLHEVRAEIIEVRHRAVGTVTLLLSPNRRWQGFRAGQHVAFTVDVDGVRHTRCYSLAGSQHRGDGLLELTVAAEPGGVVSGYLNARIRAGGVVGLSQARGDFVVPDPPPEHLLLISGGSGITPVMSIVRTLCEEGFCAAGTPGRITFLHYARSAEHVAYRDELAVLAAEHPGLELLCSYTRGRGGELSGRFDPRHLPPVTDRTAGWVCGPSGLVDAVRTCWQRCGGSMPLRTEQFSAPSSPPPPEDGEPWGQVCFARSGLRVPNTGATLLEQAEQAGLRPVFGCRSGICLTCSTRKLAGSVRHRHTGAVFTEATSVIQICSTVPVGSVVVDV